MTAQPHSQGSLLPALQSAREREGLSRSVGWVEENPGNEVVDSTACPPLQKMAKSANYQYFHFFKTFQKALCTFDCKTVCIFAYSSMREQSNKRSETRLKTVTETGVRRQGFFPLASHARSACDAHVLSVCKTLYRFLY